jgi:uncharacterized protein YegP (UPF0339 family)
MYRMATGHAGLTLADADAIVASQGYESKVNAEKGIEAVKTHAASAKVEDHTEAKPG